MHFSANSSVGRSESGGLADLADSETVVRVEAARLDDLVQDLPRVDVIKVDVEGSEVQAFTGMEQTLRANPAAVVLFEWSPAQILQVGRSPSELLDLLGGHGLRLRLLEDDLAPIDRSRSARSSLRKRRGRPLNGGPASIRPTGVRGTARTRCSARARPPRPA